MNKYGLKRNGEWNIIVMPVKYHNGRHTNYYNEFVIKHLEIADQRANGNQALFLNYFETNIRGAIISNPSILYYKEEKRVVEGVEQDTARKLGEINEGAVTRTDAYGVGLIVKDPTSTVIVEVQVIATNKEKDEKNK